MRESFADRGADWMVRWPGLLAAGAAGAVVVLGFAPFGQGWLVPLALAALFHLWRQADPAQAARLGWAFGCGLYGFGLFWLRHSMIVYGGMPMLLAALLSLLFAAALALLPALAGWLVGRGLAAGRQPWRLLLLAPAAWTAGEWLRGWILSGFPWLQLGYSQIDLPLVGFAPVLGVLGVTWLTALSAVTLVFGRSRWILLLPVLWLAGWVLSQQQWSEPGSRELRVALVQGNVAQGVKWRPETLRQSLERYLKHTLAHPEAELVIWPETAVTAFADQLQTQYLDPLQQKLQQRGQQLVLGIPMRDGEGGYFNAMLAIGAGEGGHYYKRHLVPFGEYVPLRPLLAPLVAMLAIPLDDFSVGDLSQAPVLHLAGVPVGISICYEDLFGEEIRLALPEAQLLLNASNDAWFGESLAPHQHLEIARMRAVETARPLLRATNTGISAVIGERGEVMATSAQFAEQVLSAEVQPHSGLTPYVRFGAWPSLILLGLSLLLSLALRRV